MSVASALARRLSLFRLGPVDRGMLKRLGDEIPYQELDSVINDWIEEEGEQVKYYPPTKKLRNFYYWFKERKLSAFDRALYEAFREMVDPDVKARMFIGFGQLFVDRLSQKTCKVDPFHAIKDFARACAPYFKKLPFKSLLGDDGWRVYCDWVLQEFGSWRAYGGEDRLSRDQLMSFVEKKYLALLSRSPATYDRIMRS